MVMAKMQMYNATVAVERRDFTTATDGELERVMDALVTFSAALSESERGWARATISLPAESLTQATVAAVALVEAAYGAPAIATEAMLTAEFDLRQGYAPLPELVSRG